MVANRQIEHIGANGQNRSTIEVFKDGHIVSDGKFDVIYSDKSRELSERHWSPVEVAFIAAKLLVLDKSSMVLDVGSGTGKFCHIGATVTPGTFVGVEQRLPFVKESQRISIDFKIDRVQFIHGCAFHVDWKAYSAIYLFNPFLEYFDLYCSLDENLMVNEKIYEQSIATTEANLAAMPKGTRVVTFHGFGGKMPDSYRQYFYCRYSNDYVRAWLKES